MFSPGKKSDETNVKISSEEAEDAEQCQKTITNQYEAKKKRSKNQSKIKRKSAVAVSSSSSSIEGASGIRVSSQLNRFHEATVDHDSRDILLEGVDVAIEGKDLLVNSQIKIEAGYHYGLVGRNGIGKSTFLRALGSNMFEGISSSLRVLYVDQLEDTESLQLSVLATVLAADKQAVHLQKRCEYLKEVATKDERQLIIRALHAVYLEDLASDVEAKNRVAEKRSGERGLMARNELLAAEKLLEAERKRTLSEISAKFTSTEEPSLKIEELIAETCDRLDALDIRTAEKRAKDILDGMGFSVIQQQAPLGRLSGGWRIRVALARALFMRPDVLLLDEPTNHLDLPAIIWLKNYLTETLDVEETTLVVVSHDRAFLDDVCTRIIHFRNDHSLAYYMGNYSTFERVVQEKNAFNAGLEEKIQIREKHLKDVISRSSQLGRKTGDDNLLQLAAQRKKKIERVGNEKNEHGHRFKLNRDRAGYHFTVRDKADAQQTEIAANWDIPQPSSADANTQIVLPLVTLEDASFAYGHEQILTNVNVTLRSGERIIFIGRNGSGKSTLMQLLDGALSPTTGTVHREPFVKVRSLMQHTVGNLRDNSHKDLTPVQFLADLARQHQSEIETRALLEGIPVKSCTEEDIRKHLARFGIRNETASKTPIRSLSGGQTVRVVFSTITWPSSPDVLLLDEPTNHLDMQAIEAMTEALINFKGAVVVVSHDEEFIRRLNAHSVFMLSRKTKSLIKLKNGVDEYKAKLSRKEKNK